MIFLSPPWFFYEALIAAAGAQPVRVTIDPLTFDLDLAAIKAAIGSRTRAIIINSPHNPTGKIYADATLAGLADLLTYASAHIGLRSPWSRMRPTAGSSSMGAPITAKQRSIRTHS